MPDLTFDTDRLINKMGTIVLKNKFNEDQGKYFVRLSFVKVWNKGDEIVNKPEPKTDEMKQREQQANGQQTPMTKQDNPFANANGPIDISNDDLPFWEVIKCNELQDTSEMTTALIPSLLLVLN